MKMEVVISARSRAQDHADDVADRPALSKTREKVDHAEPVATEESDLLMAGKGKSVKRKKASARAVDGLGLRVEVLRLALFVSLNFSCSRLQDSDGNDTDDPSLRPEKKKARTEEMGGVLPVCLSARLISIY